MARMKTGKRIAVIFAILAVLVSGCGNLQATSHERPEKEREPLLLWTYYETDAQKAAVEDLVQGFNRSQDKYELEWEYHGPMTEFNKKLAIGITQEEQPDIVIIDNPDMKRYAGWGELEDLTESITQMDGLDSYYPEALESVCFEGRYYGLPFCCNNVALIYNEALFQEKGLSVPRTWEEFLNCAEALTEGNRKGFAMSAIEGEQASFQILPFILAAGDDINELGGTGTQDAFGLIRDLVNRGVMSKECINWSQNDVAYKFTQGECAMMENGPWALPMLEASGISYKIASLPYPEGRESVLTGVTGGENIGVIKGKNVAGALAFMKYYNEEEQMLQTNMQANSLPPRRDVARLMLQEKPEYEIFADQMETSISRSSCRNWLEITKTLSEAQFSVIAGQMTPEEAGAYVREQGGNF